MRTSNPSRRKCKLALLAAIVHFGIVSGSTNADTFQHHGSSTIIEQDAGTHTSSTWITRDAHGQTIITRDHSNLDISVQQSDTAYPSHGAWPHPQPSGMVPPASARMLERLLGRKPGGASDSANADEAFRQWLDHDRP